jgi:hypothetical protein
MRELDPRPECAFEKVKIDGERRRACYEENQRREKKDGGQRQDRFFEVSEEQFHFNHIFPAMARPRP